MVRTFNKKYDIDLGYKILESHIENWVTIIDKAEIVEASLFPKIIKVSTPLNS